MQPRELVVGTRPSPLALSQARWVVEQLQAAARRHGLPLRFALREIRTEGDLDRETPLARFGQRGVFVRAVEQALRDGLADVAVHSLKDLPGQQPPDLVLAAYPVREDARDVAVVAQAPGARPVPADSNELVASSADRDSARADQAFSGPWPLCVLPQGARIGTGSPRRIAYLSHWRPDLTFVPIRGNVDTRLRKLREEGLDAVVLAAAGLRRLELWDDRMQPLPPEVCLPAPGQGALAVQVRADDEAALRAVSLIDTLEVRLAVIAERELLARLGGGCHVPIGALARWHGDGGERHLRLLAGVADPGGRRFLKVEHALSAAALFSGTPPLGEVGAAGTERGAEAGPPLTPAALTAAEEAAKALAREAARDLIAQGASQLLEVPD